MSGIFVGDIGTELLLDCGVNITTATLVKVLAKPPRGSIKSWVGTINGTTNVKYLLQNGDINIPGIWHLQVYIEMPGWKGRGEWVELKVSG